MQEEYQIPGSGTEYQPLLCTQCQNPLPLEPDLIRHIKMNINGPLTSWEVRRCQNCGASHVQGIGQNGEDGDA